MKFRLGAMAGSQHIRSITERKLLIFAILFAVIAYTTATVPCDLRQTQTGGVCICNATYCDNFDEPLPENNAEFLIVSSSKAGLRFDPTKGLFNLFKKFHILDHDQKISVGAGADFERATPTRNVRLNIDRATQYQKIVGFGGSHTGAVAYLLEPLPQGLQDNIYDSYYSEERGIGWNLMRMSIGGCDFDLAPWAYNEEPKNDLQLTNMTDLDARDKQKLVQIKRLKEVSGVKNLRIKGAAWSSPPWMKSNNKWTGRSHLLSEYYQTWANYHLKWLELMEANGLPVWAISTGNEPMNGVLFMYFVKFMSLGWTPFSQAVWLDENLGPTIRNSKYKDLILFGNDDQRYTFPTWFHLMNRTRINSVDYLNGLAVHWYWDEMIGPSLIDKTLRELPGKILLSSESCIGDKPWQKATPVLGSWARGEKMARGFLQDLQHGFHGWIDWNLVLDEEGGPNYVNNTVDAPIIVNTTSWAEVYKQPMFYTMGHFSKWVPEDSVRIDAVRSNVNIDTVAFVRPDGRVSAVLFNSGNANVEVSVVDSVRGAIVVNIPPKSIHTLIYK